MARDNAPVLHTCSVINEVMSAIESVEWEETYWSKAGLLNKMEKYVKQMIL